MMKRRKERNQLLDDIKEVSFSLIEKIIRENNIKVGEILRFSRPQKDNDVLFYVDFNTPTDFKVTQISGKNFSSYKEINFFNLTKIEPESHKFIKNNILIRIHPRTNNMRWIQNECYYTVSFGFSGELKNV